MTRTKGERAEAMELVFDEAQKKIKDGATRNEYCTLCAVEMCRQISTNPANLILLQSLDQEIAHDLMIRLAVALNMIDPETSLDLIYEATETKPEERLTQWTECEGEA